MGIELHDAEKYEDAIATYEKALDIDSKHQLANYEMALTYYHMGDYGSAEKYAGIAIKTGGDNTVPSYILRGSALDNGGRTSESIKMFKKAIKKTGGHHLLNYNLGLNYYRTGDRDNCMLQMAEAIDLNPSHASSHLLLGLVNEEIGNKVQTVLALSFFLYLEDNTERSKVAHESLLEMMGSNVEQDPNNPNEITINLSGDLDSEFMAAELMLSMLEAKKFTQDEEGEEGEEPLTPDQMFQENLTSFYTVMGELKEDKAKGIWWNLYTDTFYALAQSDHMEAFCRVITQSGNEDSAAWLLENEEAEKALDEWFKNEVMN